ncbi:MAG: hypothetical protein ACR2LV_03785 [Solirubrobacteraceae bacterium]
MTFLRNHLRLLLVGTSCLAAGVGASAIASAGAAPSPSAAATASAAHVRHHRALLHRAVHGDLVVHTKAGFVTVTLDRGTVQSVNGQQLTIVEGTRKATYKTVTLTIPANARVRDDRQKSTLAAVKPGQRVMVEQGLTRTIVAAHTPRSR